MVKLLSCRRLRMWECVSKCFSQEESKAPTPSNNNEFLSVNCYRCVNSPGAVPKNGCDDNKRERVGKTSSGGETPTLSI
jgi:hypothetical protein